MPSFHRRDPNCRTSAGRGGLAAVILCILAVQGCSGGEAAAREGALFVRIGVVVPAGEYGRAMRQGAELGAAEVQRAGALIAVPVQVSIIEVDIPEEAAGAVADLADEGVFAVAGGADARTCGEIGRAAAEREILYLNVGCREDSLRSGSSPSTFHVEASDWMYREAAATAGEAGAEAALWHPELFRFGAAQLNERFERRFGAPAEGGAWAAWMAIKVLWESAVRTRSADPTTIATLLLDQNTSFDGHKGQALTFSAEDHQLRQPLYLPRTMAGAVVPVEVDPLTSSGAGLTGAEWEALEGQPVPEGSYAVVSNEGSGDVVVIDVATGAIVSRIRVGSRPRGVQVGGDGRLVYVALSDDAPTVETDEDGIAMIDLRQGRVIGRFPGGTDPEQFAIAPDESLLFVANEDAGTATITDLEAGTVLRTLPVGIEPEGVAASDDGRWVYVTAETSNTVSTIDARTHEVVASFMVDVRPRAAVFSPAAPRAYVSNEISGTITVVDTDRHQVVGTIEIPNPDATPVGVAVSPDGSRLYVATGHGNSVTVIDTASLTVLGDVPVGRRPWGIEVSADGRRIYTANGLTNDVSVIDAETLQVVRTIPVGQRPWGIALTD
jgi:PQQ-dependent catabolism-associated beta-propeller protein